MIKIGIIGGTGYTGDGAAAATRPPPARHARRHHLARRAGSAIHLQRAAGMAWRSFGGQRRCCSSTLQKAVEKARYKQLEDGSWFAEIPGFVGVWAQGMTVEACRKELWDVLEEWIVLKLRDRDPLPKVRGVTARIKEVKVA